MSSLDELVKISVVSQINNENQASPAHYHLHCLESCHVFLSIIKSDYYCIVTVTVNIIKTNALIIRKKK